MYGCCSLQAVAAAALESPPQPGPPGLRGEEMERGGGPGPLALPPPVRFALGLGGGGGELLGGGLCAVAQAERDRVVAETGNGDPAHAGKQHVQQEQPVPVHRRPLPSAAERADT